MDLLEPLRQVARDVLNPRQIATAIETGIALVFIAVGAWLLLRLAMGLVRRTTAVRIGPAARMTPIIEGLLRYSILCTAVILMLDAVHINVTPVLASATVLGVALGFGAQQMIRDLLAGVFLLSEGIVQTGDLVRVEGASGTAEIGIAERITLRVTQIRKYSGELVTVPNGLITKLGNWSRDYVRAVVEVLIPYGADASAAVQAVHEAAAAWAAAHTERHADPEVAGITDLRDTGVVLQCAVLTAPGQQFAVASELRGRVLKALAKRGIIPGAVALAGPPAPTGPPRTT